MKQAYVVIEEGTWPSAKPWIATDDPIFDRTEAEIMARQWADNYGAQGLVYRVGVVQW